MAVVAPRCSISRRGQEGHVEGRRRWASQEGSLAAAAPYCSAAARIDAVGGRRLYLVSAYRQNHDGGKYLGCYAATQRFSSRLAAHRATLEKYGCCRGLNIWWRWSSCDQATLYSKTSALLFAYALRARLCSGWCLKRKKAACCRASSPHTDMQNRRRATEGR